MFRKENPSQFVEKKQILGMGSFGSVYKGVLLNPANSDQDVEVAVKIISYNGDELNQLGRELYFLKNLSSPFIVKYVDSFISKGELWIVMELCDSGSLLDICQARNMGLNEAELKGVIACSILGLVHIHERRSIHRDIKAGNILLTSRGKAMLSDFGVSTQLTDSNRRKTVIGTPYWMAPEILQETSYGENADIWSLGITIIELAQGQPPHFDAKPLRAMYMIASKPAPTLTDESKWSPEMVDFLNKCLQKDPYARASSLDLESHQWINSEVSEIQSSIRKSSNPNNASLAILKALSINSKQAIEDMRRSRQESTDSGGTFQTFNNISTMQTENNRNRAGSTWQINTMDTVTGDGTIATWNTASFNTLGFNGATTAAVLPNTTAEPIIYSPSAMSNVSTPNTTLRRPVTTTGIGSSSSGGSGTATGVSPSNAANTLRNQLNTLRPPTSGSAGSSPEQNQGNTLRAGGLSDSTRATLKKHISGGISGGGGIGMSTYTDENAATMRNELDATSRATLRNQLSADNNLDTSSSRFRSTSVASYLPLPPPGTAATGTATATTGGGGNMSDQYGTIDNRKTSARYKNPPFPPAAATSGNGATSGVVGDSSNVQTLRRALQPINAAADSYQQNDDSSATPIKNHSNSSVVSTYTDDAESLLPLLTSHKVILTCQEGNLKFDKHEIQFKMAIYGSKTSNSTGCRMEVRFGNVG